MPNWVAPVIVFVIGSGGLAGLIVPLANHLLQGRRERERERRALQATRIASQRELCLELLDVVLRMKTFLFTLRSLHDDLALRRSAKQTFQLMKPQLPSLDETVRRFRRELDLEPNAHLQGAIERWGDAANAYQQVLIRPLTSWWNPLKRILGKSPADQVGRLAADFDTQTQELQRTVRAYMAAMESSGTVKPPRTGRERAWWRPSRPFSN